VVLIADDDVEKGKVNPSVFICGSTAEVDLEQFEGHR
jgi:hypothetical protein